MGSSSCSAVGPCKPERPLIPPTQEVLFLTVADFKASWWGWASSTNTLSDSRSSMSPPKLSVSSPCPSAPRRSPAGSKSLEPPPSASGSQNPGSSATKKQRAKSCPDVGPLSDQRFLQLFDLLTMRAAWPLAPSVKILTLLANSCSRTPLPPNETGAWDAATVESTAGNPLHSGPSTIATRH